MAADGHFEGETRKRTSDKLLTASWISMWTSKGFEKKIDLFMQMSANVVYPVLMVRDPEAVGIRTFFVVSVSKNPELIFAIDQ